MTRRFHPSNERLKRAYFEYLKEADRKAQSTIDGARKAISRFEDFTGYADFREFNKDHATSFKRQLVTATAVRSGEPLSKATVLSAMNALKAFFKWAALQPGYKSRVRLSDIDYLNLAEKDVRAAKAPRYRDFPTIEQIQTALLALPADTEIQRRDRAIFAFVILTGIRDGALVSLRLKHIDLDRKLVKQDPLEVQTKFSKRIDTFFFRIGDDIETIVVEWVWYLREVKLYGNDHPLFPRTRLVQDENLSWVADGLDPVSWTTAGPVRQIFKDAFTRVGLPCFTPHSFRSTLVHLGERCSSIEEFKAWSQNLGHESVLTSLASYGRVDSTRQGELIRSRKAGEPRGDKLDEIIALLKAK